MLLLHHNPPPRLTQSARNAIKALQSQGKKVLISFGGENMTSATYCEIAGSESELAKSIAAFVIKYKIDGVDIDFEDTPSFMGVAGYNGVDFLVNLTKSLRRELPSPNYLITHAPQPPYLDIGSGMDGYVHVMKQIGSSIDWLNVQFYNNLPWSSNPYQIITSYKKFSMLQGLSPEKLLIGLPVTIQDATSGYIPINEIITKIINPVQQTGILGGMMNWQFSNDNYGVWATKIGEAISLKNIDRLS